METSSASALVISVAWANAFWMNKAKMNTQMNLSNIVVVYLFVGLDENEDRKNNIYTGYLSLRDVKEGYAFDCHIDGLYKTSNNLQLERR